MMKIWKNLFSWLIDSNCPICQRSSENIVCKYCHQQIESYRKTQPQELWQGELPVFIWGNYEANLKRAIAILKYENKPQLGILFGKWLGATWLTFPQIHQQQKIIVVPIPLHPNKLKSRGFNQTEIIAKSFCQTTGYPLQTQGLQRIKETKAMYGLDIKQRATNINKAFSVGKPFEQKQPQLPVLLIDDIYTTGTTVKEAAKVLKMANISVLGIAAIATSKKI